MRKSEKELRELIRQYVNGVEKGLEFRAASKVRSTWFSGETSSVINGLLARQATLTIKLALTPSNWDGHIAPLFLRSMIDCHISLEWILRDPVIRAREYMSYSLGQAKLVISHLEAKLEERPENESIKKLIEVKKEWVAQHMMLALVEINLGSWSGSSVRQMCQEIDDEDFYKFSFTPFSSCVHNTWEHINIYNTVPCTEPLHKRHFVPSITDVPLDYDYLYRSAKYATMSFRAFDRATGIEGAPPMPIALFGDDDAKDFEDDLTENM